MSKEPNVGLHPRSLGPCPELKADSQPLSHPGVPILDHFYLFRKRFYLFMRDTRRKACLLYTSDAADD